MMICRRRPRVMAGRTTRTCATTSDLVTLFLGVGIPRGRTMYKSRYSQNEYKAAKAAKIYGPIVITVEYLGSIFWTHQQFTAIRGVRFCSLTSPLCVRCRLNSFLHHRRLCARSLLMSFIAICICTHSGANHAGKNIPPINKAVSYPDSNLLWALR